MLNVVYGIVRNGWQLRESAQRSSKQNSVSPPSWKMWGQTSLSLWAVSSRTDSAHGKLPPTHNPGRHFSLDEWHLKGSGDTVWSYHIAWQEQFTLHSLLKVNVVVFLKVIRHENLRLFQWAVNCIDLLPRPLETSSGSFESQAKAASNARMIVSIVPEC